MANGPIKGTRVPVQLPWNGVTDGKPQYVSMKQPVAELLGLDTVSAQDLVYTTTVRYKEKGKNGESSATFSTKTVTRRRRPGYRQRAIRVEMGVNTSTGKAKSIKIGGKVVKSFQFPITKSVAIDEVVEFFESGKGKKIGAARIVDANTGQGYPIQ